MENLYIPFSAVFIGFAGFALALAVISEKEFSRKTLFELDDENEVEEFLGERLVARYVNSERCPISGLLGDVDRYFGKGSTGKLLIAVGKAIDKAPPGKLDKHYVLRGFALRELKREEEAAAAFRKALAYNQDNIEARRGLAYCYMKGKMFGLAKIEIEKALKGMAVKGAASYETGKIFRL